MPREERVRWDPTTGPYAGTAYEKEYWAEEAPEAQYMRRQLGDIAQEYAMRGGQVRSELAGKGVGPGGTIGQFAMAQRIARPQAEMESGLLKEQYGRRWTGEQQQMAGQRSYTEMLNQLALQKAQAEQKARMTKWGQRKGEKALAERSGGEVARGLGALALAPMTGGGSLVGEFAKQQKWI